MKYYRYLQPRLWESLLDTFLQPLMYFVGSKDSHWWDWEEFVPNNDQISRIRLLEVGSGHQIRSYPQWPIVGIVNPVQIFSLLKTLFVLREVALLEPVDFDGEWSLIKYAEHEQGRKFYKLSRFLTKGPVKNLCDGKSFYAGISKSNQIIDLRLLEICPRHKYRQLLFV